VTVVATPILKPGSAEPIMSYGDLWQVLVTLVFSGSYVTNGDALDFTPLLQGPAAGCTVLFVDVMGGAGNQFEYDKVNKKLKMFSSANTEAAAAGYNAAITGDVNIVAQVIAG
jgi:hypothetical protein